jgi:peptide deformylase
MLRLRIYGDKVLRSQTETVQEFGSELEPFLAEMLETMLDEGGVGLAAPQVGISKKIAVVNPEPASGKTLINMVNPRIIAVSDDRDTVEEGCLSIPGIRESVTRSKSIDVVYQDEQGVEHTFKADGLLARIIQHEVDHLNGVLFIDHLSLAQRTLLKSRLRSILQEGRRGG